jgi:hypothetical protein
MPENNLSRETGSLAAAVHYIIAKAEPGKLGYVKLNRILWYADLDHNRRDGASITGLRYYTRTPQGPMAGEISRAVGRLVKVGKVAERTVQVADYSRREMISLAEPDLATFTTEQIAILDRMIDIIAPLSATQLSQIAQQDRLWKELKDHDAMLVATGSVITRLPPAAAPDE